MDYNVLVVIKLSEILKEGVFGLTFFRQVYFRDFKKRLLARLVFPIVLGWEL